ncbi:ATP-binding protein [Streptomyces hebeiensis]
MGVSPQIAERILAPLLDNARRYAAESITVECAPGPRGGVRAVIGDDGPGVPDTVRDAIFEPGHRARPDDGHDGAGLGLPLAIRLARAAGDFLTKPIAKGGLDLGTAGSSAVLLAVVFCPMSYALLRERKHTATRNELVTEQT